MALTITNATEEVGDGIKLALFGGAGSGKTRILATAPAPLIISPERGLKSIRDQNIPVIKIGTYAEAWECIKFAKSPEAAQYQTIGVDSISEIAELHLAAIKPNHKNLMQAYGQLADDMILLIKGFINIPGKHVVLLAKVGDHTDMVTQVTKFVPNFPGKALGELFPHIMDEFWHLGMVTQPSATPGQPAVSQRVLRTAGDAQYDTRSRNGTLDPLIAVPDMPLGTNSQFLTNLFLQMNPTAASAAK